MKRYIDSEKLKAEIERRMGMHRKASADGYIIDPNRLDEDEDILSLITSLQQDQPDKYETALEKAREWMPNVNQGGHAMLIDILPELGEGLDTRYGGRKQQPEVDLDEFTKKIKNFQAKYKQPEIVSIKGAMAFMARMFYQYPNVARRWYEQLPKATMD